MTRNITPNARGLTLDGTQSMLQGIFNERVAYDLIRKRILRRLDNDDFDALCSASASLQRCLLTPHNQQGPAGATTRLRYQADLIDRCDEDLAPHGPCPNPPGSIFVNRRCNFMGFNPPNTINSHQGGAGRAPLICQGCKDNEHWTTDLGATPQHWAGQSGHTVWRSICAQAQISVCRFCNREQRNSAGDDGLDGCICYREAYEGRWYCLNCDAQLQQEMHDRAKHLQTRIRSLDRKLTHVGGRMVVRRVAPSRRPNEKPQCPCGRSPALAHALPATALFPAPQLHFANIPAPFLGTQHLETMYPLDVFGNNYTMPIKLQHTKQCVLCCGYVVPPKRRSERVRRQTIARQEVQARAAACVNSRAQYQAPTRRRSERVRNREERQDSSQAEIVIGIVKPGKMRTASKRSR